MIYNNLSFKHLVQYGFNTMMMSSLLCSKIIIADMSHVLLLL